MPVSPKMTVPLLDLKRQYAPLREQVRAALDAVLDEQALILGRSVEQFERDLAAFCGAKYAIGVSSGTDALLAAMMALGIGPGDEVICPAFTFFATAGSIARVGATPVFVDVDPVTFNIDVAQAASKITSRTKAIAPVHLFGQMADMPAIESLARAHNLHIIEDAAQAIGATQQGRLAGSIGVAGCLSFYPTKNLGALGDAGAILTSDDAVYTRAKKVRVHGSGHTYYHEMIGGMFRMAALQAAGLGVKLPHVCEWNAGRIRNAERYNALLKGVKGVVTPTTAPGNLHIYHQYVIRVQDRDRVKDELTKRGVGCAVFYPLGLHLQQCFAYRGHKLGDFPHTERATADVLALPIFPELRPDEIDYVAEQIRDVVG
jgi:dTDP-4-amino-4,6-dideoxygalactose transaminase